MPLSPKQKLALAASWRTSATEIRNRAALAYERAIEDARELEDRAIKEETDAYHELRRLGHLGTLGAVEVQTRSRGAAVSAAKTSTKTRTLFQQKLIERELSVPEWANARHKNGQGRPVKVGAETAKSWNKRPGKGGRPVPREWADIIATEFDDMRLALPEAWPNGIRE